MNQNVKLTEKTMLKLKEEQLRRFKKGERITLAGLIEEAVLEYAQY